MYARILLALDGSSLSLTGGEYALRIAADFGSELVVCHIYDAGIHSHRFSEMEPVLPEDYQDESKLTRLRGTHVELMTDGFVSLSQGYVQEFVAAARKQAVQLKEIHREGRNFAEILKIADEENVQLIIVGATGIGTDTQGAIGGCALRIVRHAACDVLVVRKQANGNPIVVGIDGSHQAMEAARRASFWARMLNVDIRLLACFDATLHSNVFRTMASALSEEMQEKAGLSEQEDLHKDIINTGMMNLYEQYLTAAREIVEKTGRNCQSTVMQGKPYRALVDYSTENDVSLLIVGRYGHHMTQPALIGSNSEMATITSSGNVLITRSVEEKGYEREDSSTPVHELTWDDDALKRTEAIPAFVRSMAIKAVEDQVRSSGKSRVTLEDFNEAARSFGMG